MSNSLPHNERKRMVKAAHWQPELEQHSHQHFDQTTVFLIPSKAISGLMCLLNEKSEQS